MDLFAIKKPKNYVIYKGSQFVKLDKELNNNPMWFGEKDIASTYGDFLHKYRTKKEIKLLDVTNGLFHLDFINKVNILCINDPNYNRRAGILLPLGLPEFDIQCEFLNIDKNELLLNENYNNDKDDLKLQLSFFQNKHRYSEYHYDKMMVSAMKLLYPDYDGYIQQIPWPTYLHKGYFCPEICLFNSYNSLEYLGKVTSGGSKNIKSFRENMIYQPDKMYWNMKEYDDYIKNHPECLQIARPKNYVENKIDDNSIFDNIKSPYPHTILKKVDCKKKKYVSRRANGEIKTFFK